MATGSSDATHRQPSRPLFNNPPSAPLSPASFTTIRQSMKATAECLPKQHSENSIRSPYSSCTASLRLRVSPRADFARDGFKKVCQEELLRRSAQRQGRPQKQKNALGHVHLVLQSNHHPKGG